ncbi:helix-turn-helix transcriptional regulator [Dialister sp.]|jgi:transcriptional regulator with XRE-family HTH domain|uniref:helix-turn-helix transcriptional regulator n=1 Tax=Dialister sp. TaxID=1955814 RepID=UPI00257FCFDA|nr:helix-turn-helix transcriptional regulator [Dialister sp.]
MMEKSKSDNTKFTLKACRVNKRLTLKEAADRLGISEFTLGNYESGKTFPTVPIIARIERLYGISYNEIIFLP